MKDPQRETLPKKWFGLFLALAAILTLPAVAVAFYARPSADDYVYAAQTHAVIQQYGVDWLRIFSAAWEANRYFYENWQGLYVSGFLLALQPGIFGGAWYGVTFFCVTAPLFFCFWGSFSLVLRRLLPGQKRWPAALAVLFTYAYIQGLPNQVEGLYWFNGAMNYIPFFALTALNTGLLFDLQFSTGKRRMAELTASCALGLVISGGHHVVGLLNMLLLLLAVLVGLKRRSGWLLCPFFAGLSGMLFNLLAPGTRVRVSGFASASLPEAVVKSFILAALQFVRYLDVPLLCLLALLTPVLLLIVKNEALPASLFRRPWIPPAVTFVLLWAMLFLPSYTMGGIGAGRLINVVWLVFVLGVSVSCGAFLGWLVRLRGVSFAGLKKFRYWPMAAAALLVCMACIGGNTTKEGLQNRYATSLEAVWELGQGGPQRFAAALDAREAALSDEETADVTIAPLKEEERPALLFFTDVSPGPDMWGLTPYYNKNTVMITEPNE